MSEWFRHEDHEYPQDFGIVFFRGWETFPPQDKVDAITGAITIPVYLSDNSIASFTAELTISH